MAGALKPPWITRADFYRTPFNYCDRWCERCDLTEICRVFQDVEKSRQKFIKQGKDPDSWECVFQTIEESFQETERLLKKEAERLGIDLSRIDRSEPGPPEPDNFPLYKLAEKFAKKLGNLLRNLTVISAEAGEVLILESTEVIGYYHHLIPAKVYRAIISKINEEEGEEDFIKDSKTSAFIAVNGLVQITEALVALAEHKPLRILRPRLVRLGKISLDLARILRLEFDLEKESKN